MKLEKNLSEMTIEELKKLVIDLLARVEDLERENEKLRAELGRTKKSRPSR